MPEPEGVTVGASRFRHRLCGTGCVFSVVPLPRHWNDLDQVQALIHSRSMTAALDAMGV